MVLLFATNIKSFQKLANDFIQQFHNNIGPKINLTDLIHCNKGVKEKVIDFIGGYKHLYS